MRTNHQKQQLLNVNDGDLKDLARNIVKEMQQISRICRNMELAASRMLHRAQKYEIDLSFLKTQTSQPPASITAWPMKCGGCNACRNIYRRKFDFDELQRKFIGQYSIRNNTDFEVKIAKLRFHNAWI